MRTINLNGYIDEEVWYGDEITPGMLHDALYGENNEFTDDVCIILNSYGGSCNAATRMHDDIRAYPGRVNLMISGTAASAATVLATAADHLEMTPGSLYMIHDPSTIAWGNERDFTGAIQQLRVCKDSILNIYAVRCPLDRNTVSAMMTATTWMDAGSALAHGFIDAVTDPKSSLANCARPQVINRRDAEAKVQDWLDRHHPQRRPSPNHQNREAPITVMAVQVEHEGVAESDGLTERTDSTEQNDATEQADSTEQTDAAAEVPPAEAAPQNSVPTEPGVAPGVPADQLHRRLELIKPHDR